MGDGHAIKLRLDNERLIDRNLDMEARIATLEKQLAAQRTIVAADDEYFRTGDRCLTSGRPKHELGEHAVACLGAREAAKGVDDATLPISVLQENQSKGDDYVADKTD